MDIKTLLHDLREEVSCPVCTNIYTDPKQLQCLHSFCLQCLKQWHRASHGGDTVRCPKCQALNKVPKSGDMKDLPTSFYLNGLIDVLAIKECKNSQVPCGNCDKKSSETSYCFQCCIFYCQECVIGHNIMRSNNDHRVLVLKDFQEKDFEDVLKRPMYCSKQRHEKEELRYFCKNCTTAACQSCVLIDHAGHAVVHLDEKAEKQKMQMKSLIETKRNDLQAKINILGQLDEDYAKTIQGGEDLKREIQEFVDNLFTTVEAKKQAIYEAVERETRKSLEIIAGQKTQFERQIMVIESSLERADKLMIRSTNAEIVHLMKSLETIFQRDDQNQVLDLDLKKPPFSAFVENQKLLNTIEAEEIGSLRVLHQTKASQSVAEGMGLDEGFVNHIAQFNLITRDGERSQCYNEHDDVTVEIMDELGQECVAGVQINDNEDGLYQISYFPRDVGKFKVTVKVDGEHVQNSPFTIIVKPFQFKVVSSFGKEGSTVGIFRSPWGVAVNARDEIAVTDSLNHRVQIFNRNGNPLRSFGREGDKAGHFKYPRGIAFHNNGRIFVADSGNHRIQIFSGEGQHVGSFGEKGNPYRRLNYPWGLSVDNDGNIIVADTGNKMIKIFSSDGMFLRKIGGQGAFTCPIHCVQYDTYLIVSDKNEHCIKVYDRNRNFQYKFGKEGEGDGELIHPACLSVNKSGHLMVCDSFNDRLQVFELNGRFLSKFGTKGSNLGELNSPRSLADLSTGEIVVADMDNNRIQIFE